LEDKKNAVATTNFVLRELAKLLAPFTPFLADMI
jgi:valyl-tRNA synthetase